MAFTDDQLTLLRSYLGYPDVFRQYDPRLESAFLSVGNLASASARVVTLLASLATVDAALASVLLGAGAVEADEVKYAATHRGSNSTGSTFLDGIRAEGRRYGGQLSALFAVPIQNDYYGEGGYGGDNWMGQGAQQGRLVPLG
jgi:hypothetical protein